MSSKKNLRKHFRERRRAIPPEQQRVAEYKLASNIARSKQFQQARSVALYFACDGEVALNRVLRLAIKHRKHCYFPSLQKTGSMIFRRFGDTRRLIRNRFNIREPNLNASVINSASLDLVLLPLVSFDATGNRLGMGAGFYDRTFARLQRHKHSKPRLIGAAHSCQQAQQLPADAWDIPLSAICTDNAFLHTN